MSDGVIAVMGATGAQGGGLVRAVLEDREGRFRVRAVTRKPDGERARALAAAGAEVVAADADDEASLERAFDGAHAAFCVTNFWEHHDPDRELRQAAAMARAAARARVRHVVWSTLDDARRLVPLDDPRLPTLKGRYKVPHCDAKGEADAFFAQAGVPTTYLLTSFYWDNFIHFGMGPRPGSDGRLVLALPLGGAKLPGIAAEDIGRCALGVFQRGTELVGARVGIAGEILDGPGLAAGLSRALGRPVAFQDVPFEAYRQLGFPGADDLANMFAYQALYEAQFCAARDPVRARALHPALLDFDGWLARHRGELTAG